MSERIVKLKNTTASAADFGGRTIPAGEYITLSADDLPAFKTDASVFAAVGNGDLIVNKGADTTDDIADPTEAWKWILGDTMPFSRHLDGKLAVHASSKPEPPGTETFAVWTGAGDDMTKAGTSESLGNGDLLMFSMTNEQEGPHIIAKDIAFDPYHGRVWIHEAYLKFEDGGFNDYLCAEIIAPGTTVIDHTVSLDLLVDGDGYITYSPGGPGTGTHGFAAAPSLLPRSFSKDGNWDFDGTNLTPNFTGTGGYRLNINEMSVHKYFNKIPLKGSSTTYYTMSSEESAWLRNDLGHKLRIHVHNNSNTNWSVSIIMEIFRERTVDP